MNIYREKINKKEFVFGLNWELLTTSSQSKVKAFLVKKKVHTGLTIKNPDGIYVGIKDNSLKVKGYSAGAFIAKKYKKPFIYVAKLNNRKWWLIASNANIPIPSTDIILDTVIDVYDKINELSQFGLYSISSNNPEVIKEYPDAELITLNEVLSFSELKKDKKLLLLLNSRIKQLRGLQKKTIYTIICFSSLLIIGYFTYKQYENYLIEKAKKGNIINLSDAEFNAIDEKQKKKAIIEAVKHETNHPLSKIFIDDCLEHLNQAHFFIGFWKLTHFECNARNIRYQWDLPKSSLGFKSDLNETLPNEHFSFNRTTAVLIRNRVKLLKNCNKKKVSELFNKNIYLDTAKHSIVYNKIINNFHINISAPNKKIVPYLGPDKKGRLVLNKTINGYTFYTGTWDANGQGLWVLHDLEKEMPNNIMMIKSMKISFPKSSKLGDLSTINWKLEGQYAAQ